MQAGETGVLIQVFPYALPRPPEVVSLNGATCILTVRNPLDIATDLTLTVSNDGTYAYRYTLATDFPMGGVWNVQFVSTFMSGAVFKSPIQQLNVGLVMR